jgi:hypothetical protein
MISVIELEISYCLDFIANNPYISFITDSSLLVPENHANLQKYHDFLFITAKQWNDMYRLYISYLKFVGLDIFIPLAKEVSKQVYWDNQELSTGLLDICILYHRGELDIATAIFSMETLLLGYVDRDHPIHIDYFNFRGLIHSHSNAA